LTYLETLTHIPSTMLLDHRPATLAVAEDVVCGITPKMLDV
jgi:hypothetical protein